jgi:hypothetical protein
MVISNLLDSVGVEDSGSFKFSGVSEYSGRVSLCESSVGSSDSNSDVEAFAPLTVEEFSAELTTLLTPQEGDATPKSSLHLAAKHSDKVEVLFR